jgi:hypothetical protein
MKNLEKNSADSEENSLISLFYFLVDLKESKDFLFISP